MKKIFCFFLTLIFTVAAFSETLKKSAETLRKESLECDTVQESIEYLKNHMEECASAADKRSLLYFLGTLQEQSGVYTDASHSYAQSAGISAADAKNMPKVTTEQLVLDAVRASLCSGDYETADSYLNSAVRSSKNQAVQAYITLYSVWSSLCRAGEYSEIQDTVALLKAYVTMESLKPVRPELLFTLWYITGERPYGETLLKDYPDSAESLIVKGEAQVMTSPFWYFVPRKNDRGENSAVPAETKAETETVKNTQESSTSKLNLIERENSGKRKWQLGLFREKKNALDLAEKARNTGFDAYVYSEKRSNGTVYYITAVDENSEKTTGTLLKNAGFESYPID